MANETERVSVNLSGWNAVADRVKASNNDISASVEVEFNNNDFQHIGNFVATIDDIEKLVNHYKEAVKEEVENMKTAGRVMWERDQADNVVFTRDSKKTTGWGLGQYRGNKKNI